VVHVAAGERAGKRGDGKRLAEDVR
jgi:hypothetical protein